jgi:hypothetical protein
MEFHALDTMEMKKITSFSVANQLPCSGISETAGGAFVQRAALFHRTRDSLFSVTGKYMISKTFETPSPTPPLFISLQLDRVLDTRAWHSFFSLQFCFFDVWPPGLYKNPAGRTSIIDEVSFLKLYLHTKMFHRST